MSAEKETFVIIMVLLSFMERSVLKMANSEISTESLKESLANAERRMQDCPMCGKLEYMTKAHIRNFNGVPSKSLSSGYLTDSALESTFGIRRPRQYWPRAIWPLLEEKELHEWIYLCRTCHNVVDGMTPRGYHAKLRRIEQARLEIKVGKERMSIRDRNIRNGLLFLERAR